MDWQMGEMGGRGEICFIFLEKQIQSYKALNL